MKSHAIPMGLVLGLGCSLPAEATVRVFDVFSNPDVSVSTSALPGGGTNVTVTLLGTASSAGSVFIETSAGCHRLPVPPQAVLPL